MNHLETGLECLFPELTNIEVEVFSLLITICLLGNSFILCLFLNSFLWNNFFLLSFILWNAPEVAPIYFKYHVRCKWTTNVDRPDSDVQVLILLVKRT